MIPFIMGFGAGVIVTIFLMIFFDVDKPAWKDYYEVMAKKEYYKAEYRKIHNLLSLLDEGDVKLIDKYHYNHFILKKEDNIDFWEDWLDEGDII